MLRLLKSVVVFFAALVILFEEWLWEPLKRMMQVFGRLPLIRRLAAAIAGLSPRAAVFVYLCPMVVLFPFKLIGLWLIAQHHTLLGLATFLFAKVIGTALFAWLFGLTKPALMQISWFAKAYGLVLRISATAHGWIHRQPLYQWLRTLSRRVRERIARFMGS